MALTRQDETDLLTAVHDGPFEQPLWATFLDRLRARVRADHAGLLLHTPELLFLCGRVAPLGCDLGDGVGLEPYDNGFRAGRTEERGVEPRGWRGTGGDRCLEGGLAEGVWSR